jgi:cadmium resistance protein CadD (predicted permease)
MLETLLVGVMLFVSTNIDDVFLTMAFFADPRLDPRAVVLGKYVGIAALVAASLAAAACALAVPHQWIALLGFAPLGLGIHRLWSAWRSTSGSKAGSFTDDARADTGAAAGPLIAQAASVSVVTAANGGDNLGVYIPVFADDLAMVPIYVAIFTVMTGLWCIVGRALVTHRLVAATMRRLAGVLLPWVLIGLGLWILSDAIGLVRPVPRSPASESPPPDLSCLRSYAPCPGA